MSEFNPIFNDRVKYLLGCKQHGNEIIIDEPIGWKTDNKEYARNEDYHGIFVKFSNSLKFVGNARNYITVCRKIYGVKAKFKLTRYERHPKTDKWFRTYWGYLDMTTWEEQDKKVSIKFNSGGLEQLIKSRDSEQVEIDRTTTISGNVIPALNTEEVYLEGRRIFLKSKWNVKPGSDEVDLYVYSNDGNTRSEACGFPLNIVSSSHEQAQSVIQISKGFDTKGTTGMMILAGFDRQRTLTIRGTKMSFKPIITNSDWQWAFFQVNLTVYKDGSDYNIKKRHILLHYGAGTPDMTDMLVYNPGIWYMHNNTLTLPDWQKTIDVDAGDSVAIEVLIKADLENFVSSTARFSVNVTQCKGDVFVDEDSFFENSKSKFLLMHEFLERLVTICSDEKNKFYSEYFGRTDLGYQSDGPGAYIGATHGFWIRGFDKLPVSTDDNPNLFRPLTTSLKDAIDSNEAVFNIGLGIEEINNEERVRVEDLKFFYNNNVTIRLPNQVKNVKRSTASKYLFTSVDVGYDKGGDYEEAQGLDEPNGKTNFTTTIDVGKETFERVSVYRADSYGKEFARRKPITLNSTQDTQYDSDIWFLDLKKGLNNIFLERKWQDDFEVIPTGIFSPDTANSLRLSPLNNLLRSSWFLAAAVAEYPSDYLRYGSSTANSKLKTKLIGKNEYAENDNILNSELQTARFVPEWIEFEHECTFEVMEQVNGKTKINGKEIQNFYGTVEFINEDGQTEKGFLFNLKPNDKGVWRVLKSNRK